MKNLFTICLFLFISSISAQNQIKSIKGSVKTDENQKPIPFASIYVKNSTIGTITNEEGNFLIHIPETYQNGTLVISAMGYTTVEKTINTMDSLNIFTLNEEITSLDEVLISSSAKALTAKEIVQKAYNSRFENYPSKPYILFGFLRDLQKEDSLYVELLECALKLKAKPFKIKRDPSVQLLALRTSHIANKNEWNEQWDRKNSVGDLIEDDPLRFEYGPVKGKGWKYKLVDKQSFRDKEVYRIDAIKKPFSKATLFIDTESFAFVRIEIERKAHKGKSWKRRLTNGQQVMHYHLVREYQPYQNKWYLKYLKEEDTWQIYEGYESKNILFTKHPKKELFINQIITENVEVYPFKANISMNKSVESQAKPFDPEFWKNYNAPVTTKELSTIEKYLKESKDP